MQDIIKNEAVIKDLIALHQLIKSGKGEFPEAELIRDSLDASLYMLNSTEYEQAQWFSEYLYSINNSDEHQSSRGDNRNEFK